MISYKEEYFKLFAQEKVFNSSSFKALKNNLDTVTFYGPYQTKEEQGFVKEAKSVLDIITGIIRKPQITIKNTDTIVRSEQASNIDSSSFIETMQDPSLWKRKNGRMTPENVHIKEVTDTYVLYENIFVTRVLDFLNNELLNIARIYEKKVGNLSSYFETEAFSLNEYGVLSYLSKKDQPINDILYQNNEDEKITIESLTKLLKKCSTLMSTPFYKEVSVAKAKRKEIVMTNILLKDRRYFNCYKFYKKYISSKDESYLLPLYSDYVLLRVLNDLKGSYSFNEVINNKLVLTHENSFKLSCPIYFQDKTFSYSIEKDKFDHGLIVSIKPKKERNVEDVNASKIAKHYILLALDLNSENYKEIKVKMDKKKEEGYNNVTLFTLQNNTHHYHNIMTCSFYRDDDTNEGIKNLFLSYHLLFECDINTYEHTCPICGKRSVHKDDDCFYCSSCKSNWTSITLNKKQYLWIKGLGGK